MECIHFPCAAAHKLHPLPDGVLVVQRLVPLQMFEVCFLLWSHRCGVQASIARPSPRAGIRHLRRHLHKVHRHVATASIVQVANEYILNCGISCDQGSARQWPLARPAREHVHLRSAPPKVGSALVPRRPQHHPRLAAPRFPCELPIGDILLLVARDTRCTDILAGALLQWRIKNNEAASHNARRSIPLTKTSLLQPRLGPKRKRTRHIRQTVCQYIRERIRCKVTR